MVSHSFRGSFHVYLDVGHADLHICMYVSPSVPLTSYGLAALIHDIMTS